MLDNSFLSTEEVSSQIATRPDISPYASIVGAWVWVEFPDKPAADIRGFLKELGFRWNRSRNAWQHPCGVFRARMKNGDPREVYGRMAIKTEEEVAA